MTDDFAEEPAADGIELPEVTDFEEGFGGRKGR
jgi:hypothetical protein